MKSKLFRSLTLSLTAAACFTAFDASAQDPAPKPTPAPEKPDDPAPDRPSRAQRMLERFDENGDGKLAISELPEFMAERMKSADTDADGFITAAELDAMPRPERGGRDGSGRDGAGRRGGDGEEGRGRGGERGGFGGRRGFDSAQMLERFDANKDGKLAADELPERMAERLMAGDLDKDGFLTVAEMKKAEETRRLENAKRLMARFDENEDGKITSDEIPERGRARIELLDTNKDGVITLAELSAPPPVAEGTEGAGRNASQLIERRDTNKDGKLTGDEIPGWMQRRMDTLDKNGDGALTADELGGGRNGGRNGGRGGERGEEKKPAPPKGGVDL